MVFLENVGRRSKVDNGEFSFWVQLGDKSLNGNEYNRLFQNDGQGHFDDVAYGAGCDRREDGRAVVATDVDADGDLDLVVQSFEGATVLLINQGTTDAWLQVRLRGTQSNRDAIGARITVEAGGKTQLREVRSTAGYLGGSSLQAHFGLGRASRVDRLTVAWPSGQTTVLTGLAANQRLTIIEGAGLVDERPK